MRCFFLRWKEGNDLPRFSFLEAQIQNADRTTCTRWRRYYIGYPVKLKTHNVDHSLTVGRLPVSYFKAIVYFTVKGYWRVVFFCIRR